MTVFVRFHISAGNQRFEPTNTPMATHCAGIGFGVSESMFTLFMALTSGWACSNSLEN